MPSLSFRHADGTDVPLLARLYNDLLEQQGIVAELEPVEYENRIRSFLDDGYEAVVFQWDNDPAVGYALYRRYPKYAYIRHFYLNHGSARKLRVPDAFDLLRGREFTNYASIRLDIPESAKQSLQTWESIGFRPRSVRLELHTARKRKTRKACGAVIYQRRFGSLSFLVVQHEDGGHWGFPKGHVVAGETEMDTARREIAEETGLHVRFRDGFYERIYYLTPKERRKEVIFFLARVRRPRVRIQRSEIRAYRWAPYWETRELLTYENTKLVLDKAHEFIQERGRESAR